MAVIENNQTTDRKAFNWLTNFCCFFKLRSNSRQDIDVNMSILELTSRLCTRSQLDSLLKTLPEDSYETNANQSIYSLKINGKPFFIDFYQYNYDIYRHQTTVGNGTYFCDKHRDLMYVLRTLFYGHNTRKVTPRELQFVLEVLPQSYYEVNANQTIYSFKLNGKPFFIDKSQYVKEDYPLEIDGPSLVLGEKYAQMNRLVFIQLKTRPKNSLKFTLNSGSDGLNDSPNTDPKENAPKVMANKLNKNLAKRRVYQKSDLMIRTISSKEAKHILNKCKESLFNWRGRHERRKRVEIEAKLSPVNNCDLLSPQLYAICEAIEPNDVNHNPNH